jgi:hypothetical protein
LGKLPSVIEPVLRAQNQKAMLETELNTGEKVPGLRSGHMVAVYWVGMHWVRIYRLFADYGVAEN